MFLIEELLSLFKTPKAIMIGLAGLVGISMLIYVYVLHGNVDKMKTQLSQYASVVEAQVSTILHLHEDSNHIQDANNDINSTITQNSETSMKLIDRLNTIHDAKNDVAIQLINQEIRDRFRCFELITGAPAVKGEKNTVCPNSVGSK